MMHKLKFILLIISVLFITEIVAQENSEESENDKLSLTESTVENQFEYVIQRSNNYQEFKVVKKTWLVQLKSQVLDSLNEVKIEVKEKAQVIDSQSQELLALKEDLSQTKTNLNNTVAEKDSMRLFGLQLSKTGYNVILWSIIGILVLLLFWFIFKYHSSNTITNNIKNKLLEVEDEFEEHRRIALEREQKVRRQLQDELNKQKPRK